MPGKIIKYINATIKYTYHLFSIPYLLKTLFEPWKRDISGSTGQDIRGQFESFINNLIARVMGFIVRTATIIAGIIVLFFSIILLFIFFLGWMLLPISAIFLLFYGIYLGVVK